MTDKGFMDGWKGGYSCLYVLLLLLLVMDGGVVVSAFLFTPFLIWNFCWVAGFGEMVVFGFSGRIGIGYNGLVLR